MIDYRRLSERRGHAGRRPRPRRLLPRAAARGLGRAGHQNRPARPRLRRDPQASATVPVVTSIASLADPPADAYDAYLRLHLLSHRLIRPHEANLDGHLRRAAPTSPGRATGPVDPVDAPGRPARAPRRRRAVPGLLRRQVPAHDRLRRARPACGSPTPTASASARTSPRARRSCTRASCNFNAGTLGHLDGRGPDQRRRRRRRRLRHRRRRVDHGHAVRRRDDGDLDRRALPARRQRRHRHLARRRLRGRGRALPDRRARWSRCPTARSSRRASSAARTACCSAATRRPAPSRRCRARAPGAGSTPPCTPTSSSAARSHSASVGTSASRR